MATALITELAETVKQDTLNAAYTAWLMGAGKEKTFKAFCQDFGLIEKDVLTDRAKELRRRQTFEAAAQIIDADQRARKQNGQNGF